MTILNYFHYYLIGWSVRYAKTLFVVIKLACVFVIYTIITILTKLTVI